MSVSLYKGIHLWTLSDPEAEEGEGIKICFTCGSVLEAEVEPYSDLCAVLHDAYCKCVACKVARR